MENDARWQNILSGRRHSWKGKGKREIYSIKVREQNFCYQNEENVRERDIYDLRISNSDTELSESSQNIRADRPLRHAAYF